MTEYICVKCNLKTNYFKDMKQHINRKFSCSKKKKNKLTLIYSEDQLLVLSLIPYYDNKHTICIEELEYLKDSDIMFEHKSELFDIIDKIEKNSIKICPCCNTDFDKIMNLKTHLLNNCFYKYLINKQNNKQEQNSKNVININDIIFNNNISNININNTNNIFINFDTLGIKSPIPFDKDWDTTHISEEKKSQLIISTIMYTQLLEEILNNEINLNVIMDKEHNTGMVYKNDNEKYIQMKSKDIIDETMVKLNKCLNEFNKNQQTIFNEIKTFCRQMINKKLIDFQNDEDINVTVSNLMSEMFEKNKINAKHVAKFILEKEPKITGF